MKPITILAMLLAISPLLVGQQSPEAALRAAMQKETVDGDLKAAIEQYKKLAQNSNKSVAARALVRLGECYEKQGNAEARKTYEQVLSKFGDQAEAVAQARTRLAAMVARADTGLMQRRVGLYSGVASEGAFASGPSPDGRYMAVANWDSGALELIDLGSGKVQKVKDGERAFFPVLSSDGGQIAYGHRALTLSAPWSELRLVGTDGSKMRALARVDGPRFDPLDWSADGRQILVWNGTSLAVVSTADGSVRPLGSPVRSFQARFSPDGRYVAYERYRDEASPAKIFLIAVDGSREMPLVEGTATYSSPVWTPDGRKVVFVSDWSGKPDLWSIRVVDGKPQGSPERLKSDAGSIQLMGFTRDGSLYFATRTNLTDVYTADLDPATGKVTSQPKRISERFVGQNTGPLRWSPDGRSLAHLNRGTRPSLKIHATANGEEREVPGVEPLLASLGDYLAWFPDSRSMLVMSSPASREFVFRRVDVETGKTQTTFQVPDDLRGSSSRLAQDGKTLFYARRESCGDQTPPGKDCVLLRLVAHDLGSGAQRELYRTRSPGARLFLALSADGRQLAVLRPPAPQPAREENPDKGPWSLMVVPVDGGAPREVRTLRKQFRGMDSIAWTADGRHVLVAQADSQLWSYPLDGGEPQPCGLTMPGLWWPAISPDGRRIAFGAGSSQDELWVIRNLPGI